MTDLRLLQRQRSAAGPRTQAEEQGDRSHQPADRRAVAEHVGELRRFELGVAHERGQPGDQAATEEGDEIHPIGDLEPLELGRPTFAPGVAEVDDGTVEHGGRHQPTTAGRSGSADHPDHDGVYSRVRVTPACSRASRLAQAETPEPQ